MVTIISSNAWLGFVFGVSMQPLFDMINSLQITALLPLNNITIPANVMVLFQLIVTIVAFDFFPFYDHYNPGFTPTEPYTEKFAWFGFDSVNYVEDLGFFLGLLIVILILNTLIGLLIQACTYRYHGFFIHQPLLNKLTHTFKKDGWVRNKFDSVILK